MDDDVARVIQRLTSAVDLTTPVRGVPSHTRAWLRRQARRWLTEQLPSGREARRDAVTYLRHPPDRPALPLDRTARFARPVLADWRRRAL